MNIRHILMAAAFAAIFSCTAKAQTTQAYPAIPGSETSALYSLSANGTAVWVEKIGPGGMEDLHVAAFSCSGTQHIVIEADQPVSTFTIQPKHAGIQATADGKKLSFDIDGPGKYYIRVNDNPYLALFANAPETDVPGKKDKDVIVYGPGVHEAGRIVLQDNMSIYLAPGALVTGNISGTGKNVHIWGRGSINGNWGEHLEVSSDGTFSYVVDYVLPAGHYAPKSRLAAVVFNYDSHDLNNCAVMNGAETPYLATADLGISQSAGLIALSVYPNPVSNTLSVAAGSPIREIRMTDLVGREVLLQHSIDSESATVRTSHLAAGLYLLTVKTDEGLATQRISVVR